MYVYLNVFLSPVWNTEICTCNSYPKNVKTDTINKMTEYFFFICGKYLQVSSYCLYQSDKVKKIYLSRVLNHTWLQTLICILLFQSIYHQSMQDTPLQTAVHQARKELKSYMKGRSHKPYFYPSLQEQKP
jgi:hypothetical protein